MNNLTKKNFLFYLIFIASFSINTINATEEVSFSSKENQTGVIELFTSQGCSSCPPAEKWLNSLKEQPQLWSEIVPIAFHVDYWDKLGWPDIYASQAFSARQYRYRRQNDIQSVYTPGLVYNGKEWRGWSRSNSFPPGNPQAGVLSFEANQKKIQINYSRPGSDIILNVALLGFGIDAKIERGENQGRTLRQEFVALSHRQYAASNGNWNIPLPRERATNASEYAIAIWVSRMPSIAPVQATGYWIPVEWIHSSS